MKKEGAAINKQPVSTSYAPKDMIDITPPSGWFDIDFAELWRSRELGYFFVWRTIKIRYKQTLIGAAWAVIQPIVTMLVFSLFLGKLAKVPSGGLPYPVFYFSALLPWSYFSGAMQTVTNSVVEQQHVVTKVYFPRLLLPIASVLPGLLDFAIGLVIFLPMIFLYHLTPGIGILMLPIFLMLALCTALSIGLWLAALNSLYRDVSHVVPFLLQIWMFVSPVVYPASLVPARWRVLYGLNPMAGVIEGFRWSLTGHGEPPTLLLLVSACGVLIAFLGGLSFFHRVEGTITDVV